MWPPLKSALVRSSHGVDKEIKRQNDKAIRIVSLQRFVGGRRRNLSVYWMDISSRRNVSKAWMPSLYLLQCKTSKVRTRFYMKIGPLSMSEVFTGIVLSLSIGPSVCQLVFHLYFVLQIGIATQIVVHLDAII